MNKNPHILYLSGLISEEQLNETSDMEHSMALAQKMQNEFNELHEKLADCLAHCKDLEKQAYDNYAHHDKTGVGRVDSNGVGDAGYFEDVSYELGILHKELRKLFGIRMSRSSTTVDEIGKSLQRLIDRLNTDFDPT